MCRILCIVNNNSRIVTSYIPINDLELFVSLKDSWFILSMQATSHKRVDLTVEIYVFFEVILNSILRSGVARLKLWKQP